MASSKKKHLPETDIQSIATLETAALAEKLTAMGTNAVVSLIQRLQTSYMIAARVANAAWGYYEESNKGYIEPETVEKLRLALHDYSPANFPVHGGELEVLVDELGDLHHQMQGMTADECRELVEERHTQYLEALRKQQQPEPPVPRTPV